VGENKCSAWNMPTAETYILVFSAMSPFAHLECMGQTSGDFCDAERKLYSLPIKMEGGVP